MTAGLILAVNAGSSSLKFAVFDAAAMRPVLRGLFDSVGNTHCRLTLTTDGDTTVSPLPDATHAAAVGHLIGVVKERFGAGSLRAAGHRVVHGGPDLDAPVLITPASLEALTALSPLAPLHQPHNLAAIRAIAEELPELPQVACCDTAFHRHHPEVAEVYAIPADFAARGVRRYGFHGISYEYIARKLTEDHPELGRGRTIVAHLGSGASICAMSAGRSIDSTMGFSALDGLPMGTRPGQIDPGVIFHLLREGVSAAEIERQFYRESGLKGLSGLSGDMRELEKAGTSEAAFAIEYYCHRIAREIGALAVSLGGLDGLIFTAGIGENSAAVRQNVCDRLGLLGIAVDEDANRQNAEVLSTAESAVQVLRLRTDEEQMLARHAADLTGAN